MKRIILVRHATAEAQRPDAGDFDRSLRKRGRKESASMVDWYNRNVGAVPDLLLSSPAHRAIETARLFAKGLGYRAKRIVRDKSLYEGLDVHEFLDLVRGLDDNNDTVMVFGHDPTFSEFASYLVRDFEDSLPKCSVFGVSLNRRRWHTVRPADGKIAFYQSPDGLRESRGHTKEVRRAMSARIERGVRDALAEFGVESDERTDGRIRRASRRIARALAPRVSSDFEVPASASARENPDEENAT